ncbi:hypothetical protein NDU88_005595 [Pleurodeles waltl]|uniref:Uncharacterized protein n=1 Tax=Pleurodeles waltl TaxID=8319 RepID=A0AAV7QLQ2_PLEWA|nr:hypothetical protein NDU88_005595 [Pleurodeles waltl]
MRGTCGWVKGRWPCWGPCAGTAQRSRRLEGGSPRNPPGRERETREERQPASGRPNKWGLLQNPLRWERAEQAIAKSFEPSVGPRSCNSINVYPPSLTVDQVPEPERWRTHHRDTVPRIHDPGDPERVAIQRNPGRAELAPGFSPPS